MFQCEILYLRCFAPTNSENRLSSPRLQLHQDCVLRLPPSFPGSAAAPVPALRLVHGKVCLSYLLHIPVIYLSCRTSEKQNKTSLHIIIVVNILRYYYLFE